MSVAQTILELMEGWGFTEEFRKPEQYLIRFKGRGTFIDLWQGKKGMTAGVYHPMTGAMTFHRFLNRRKLEDLLVEIHDAPHLGRL